MAAMLDDGHGHSPFLQLEDKAPDEPGFPASGISNKSDDFHEVSSGRSIQQNL
jgi:hypothetical protein